MSAGPGADRAPIADAELERLFTSFAGHERVLVAVSGGPDSTALLHLAVRWRSRRGTGPELAAATVDHGLRPESAAEAAGVAALARRLGIAHHIRAWTGTKPQHGLQDAARTARYALLLETARAAGATALALAHTRDDQAETVLFRLARGSGLTGLAAMRAESRREEILLLRPFLDIPKARLVATLDAAGIGFVRDPGNADPRFARPRLRALAPGLAAEGLDARRLAALARRLARADAALEAAADEAGHRLAHVPAGDPDAICLDLQGFVCLPEEVALRLLGRVVAQIGTEGPVELAKLETLLAALLATLPTASLAEAVPAATGFRRTLAGALVAVRGGELHVRPAPARRKKPALAPNSSASDAGVLGKRGPRS